MVPDLSLDAARLDAALTHWLSHEAQRVVFVTDTRFRLVLWNQWMEIHSGRLASDVVGVCLFELYPEAATRGIRENYEGALDGGVTVLSHAFHRYLLALPPTNTELGAAEMPQSAHIGPLVLDGAVISVEGGLHRPPMERIPATAALFERARAIAASMGVELGEGATGGGSDGNFTAALGLGTLDGLGPEGAGAHDIGDEVTPEIEPRHRREHHQPRGERRQGPGSEQHRRAAPERGRGADGAGGKPVGR